MVGSFEFSLMRANEAVPRWRLVDAALARVKAEG